MLNGKGVTNGVTNGVTCRHEQLETRLAKAEKARLRKQRQRAKEKIEKIVRLAAHPIVGNGYGIIGGDAKVWQDLFIQLLQNRDEDARLCR